MHPLFEQASGITHDVIGAVIEVHKDKGPGLLESIYQWRLTMERGLRRRQVQSESTEKSEATELLHSVRFVVSC